MDEAKEIWSKVVKRLFFPEKVLSLVWIAIGPLAILCTMIALVAASHALHAFLLTLAMASFVFFWKATFRLSVIFITALFFFASYCIFSSSSINPLLDRLWLLSLFLGLGISLLTTRDAKEYFQESFARSERAEKDRDLWETRFHTLKEKKEGEIELWENEIEGVKFDLQEKCDYIESLKRLVAEVQSELSLKEEALVMQILDKKESVQSLPLEIEGRVIDQEELNRIVRELNESRTQHYQTTVLLEDAKSKLLELEAVGKAKQKRNQTLLAAKAEGSISLKDLARGLSKN